MAVTLFATERRYVANELTFLRGDSGDVTAVGVYHNTNPAIVPTVAQFTMVELVEPPNPLAEGNKIDVLSLIGPGGAPADLALAAGTWQRWVLVQTATENMIFKVDMITVEG
jgi:hypothetical protein